MCSINHNKKAIFIHINKTGGSYIATNLQKYYGFTNYYLKRPDHNQFCYKSNKNPNPKYKQRSYENKIHGVLHYYRTSPHLNRRMNMDQYKWKTYFKFTFVRDPYDRVISGYNHLNPNNLDLGTYLKRKFLVNDLQYIHVFMPQIKHVYKANLRFIGRFENLENDFQKILHILGFNKILHNPRIKINCRPHDNYKKYYNQEILDLVNILFKNDFLNFKYKVYEKIEDLNTIANEDTTIQHTIE